MNEAQTAIYWRISTRYHNAVRGMTDDDWLRGFLIEKAQEAGMTELRCRDGSVVDLTCKGRGRTMAVTTANIQALLAMLPTVLNLISVAASMTGAAGAVPKYLTLLATIVGQGAKAYDQLTQLRELIAVMVEQQREPTADEWSSWELRNGIAHNRIQDYDVDTETEKPADV